VFSVPDICPMRDQRRRYDSNEFAPKRGYYVSFPLNNGERHFELELVAPHPVLSESVSGEFIPPIYKGCKRYLFLRFSRHELIGGLAVSGSKYLIAWEIQRRREIAHAMDQLI
jgi:hypothetical protein